MTARRRLVPVGALVLDVATSKRIATLAKRAGTTPKTWIGRILSNQEHQAERRDLEAALDRQRARNEETPF